MTKSLLLIAIFILVLYASYSVYRGVRDFSLEGQTNSTPTTTVTPSPTAFPSHTVTLNIDGKQYFASWFVTSRPENLSLIPNFSEKLSSAQIINKYNCQKGVNANFYDKNDHPLGIFVGHSFEKKTKLESDLFNGIFFIKTDGSFGIGEDLPENFVKTAVQSGPLLILNGNTLPLRIIDDKQARRMVVGVNNREVVFLSVYDEKSNLQGPYLAKLPELVSRFSQKTNLKINSALNLDGGSASAFDNKEIRLEEVSAVGGFFCLQ